MAKHYDIEATVASIAKGLAESHAIAGLDVKTEDERRFHRIQGHFSGLRLEGLRGILVCQNEQAPRRMTIGALADAMAGILVNLNAMRDEDLIDDFELFVQAMAGCVGILARAAPGEAGCVEVDLKPQTVGHA